MPEREDLLVWLCAQILPHEPAVRIWLRRVLDNPNDIEDVLQETYCKLWTLPDTDKIVNPRAFFFRLARNVVIDGIRKARVIRIDAHEELADLNIPSDEASPERVVSARGELRRVQKLIENLPTRCRQVFQLRKVEGLSQRETAEKLHLPEYIVENETSRGLKLILSALAAAEDLRPSSLGFLRDRRSRGKS